MSADRNALLRAALSYATERGWYVFPLAEGTKDGPLVAHNHLAATTDRKQIRQWWGEEYPGANIGVDLKRSKLVVVDSDVPHDGEASSKPLIERLALPTTLRARTATGKTHYYFSADSEKPITRLIRPMREGAKKIALDILGNGYVVAAPSYREDTGKSYRWLDDGADPAPLPKSVRQLVAKSSRRESTPLPADALDLRKKMLPARITEGHRDNLLTSLAGSMRRRGASENAMLAALRVENEARCVPPLDDNDVRKIARSIAKKRPDDTEPAVLELNKTYAIVQIGNDVCILQERGDEICFLQRRAFELLLGNRFIDVAAGPNGELRPIPLAKAWLSDEGRRKYDRLVFAPGASTRPGEYNLWRGWAIEPSEKGSCELFLAHLRDVVCGSDDEHYEWLLDWLADIIQFPQRKLGLAVALQGPQGAGKSIVGAILKHILDRYQVVVEKQDQVVGRFNGHLAHCLLLQAEEAFWAGNRAAEGVLKHLVTGEELQIERKGVDSVSMKNYTRLLITSNSDWIWPTDMDDRRLVIFEVKGKYRTNKDYFDRLRKQMLERGGCAKLLSVLQARDIDEKRLQTPPRTKALEHQAVESMQPDEAWLRTRLLDGVLPGDCVVDDNDLGHVPVGALYEQYKNEMPKGRHVKNEIAFGKFLTRNLPRVKGVEYDGPHYYTDARGMRHRSKGRVIASLEECRERYSKRGRGAPQTWPKKVRSWTTEETEL